MKFRLCFQSFQKNLIIQATQQVRSSLLQTDCQITGAVSFPTKRKKFCVLRSPHIDKDSREHFEVQLYKRIFELHTDSPSVFDILLKTEIPSGVSCQLKVLDL